VAERLRSILRCPGCRGELEDSTGALACAGCGGKFAVDEGIPRLVTEDDGANDSYEFYNESDTGQYGRETLEPQYADPIESFLAETPGDQLVVEVGPGRGAFDGAHPGLVELDYSWTALRAYCSGLRVQASAEELPFADGSVDAIFTLATLEHVPDPARAMAEMHRCLRVGGRLLLYPAWFVRPWAAKALGQRSYAELPPLDRLRKATIPVRDRRPYQFIRVLPGRLTRELRLRLGRPVPFEYRKLEPNLEEFLVSDSDAFSSMDPQAAASYFISRGYRDLRRPSASRRLMYVFEPVLLEKGLARPRIR
jgi:SAM-dependent methyltransferase